MRRSNALGARLASATFENQHARQVGVLCMFAFVSASYIGRELF